MLRIQNTIRDCLLKFRPDKAKCGVKTPVLAAVRDDKNVTYVKFGDQFCIRDTEEVSRLLREKSFNVNLKSLIS